MAESTKHTNTTMKRIKYEQKKNKKKKKKKNIAVIPSKHSTKIYSGPLG